MQDYQLLEKTATFKRERVPERIVRAKGSGTFGTLTLANDISRYSKAAETYHINPFDLNKVWPHAEVFDR